MEVWDPKDKPTVFSQIKSFIFDRTGALTGWVVRLYPGNLTKKARDGLCEEFYTICEHYGSAINNWAWKKRWNKGNQHKWNKITNKVEYDRILIGSDHRGYNLKEDMKGYLLKNKHRIIDVGTYDGEATDYPSIAQTLCSELLDDRIETTKGILICGSGYGMSMAANRYKEIYAITARTIFDTEIARQHGNINVLCLGADFTTKPKAELLLDTFLHTDFEGGRHARRIEMMNR